MLSARYGIIYFKNDFKTSVSMSSEIKRDIKFKLFHWEIRIVISRLKEVKKVQRPEGYGVKIGGIKKRAKKAGLTWCNTVEKIQYPEALAKLKAENHKKAGRYMRAYRCQFCELWHLTHHKSLL